MEEKKEIARVQDDLFLHVNGEWLQTAVIPEDKTGTGGFSDLAKDVEELMISEFKNMASGKTKVDDENLKKAIMLFNKGINVKKRNKDGIKPLLKTLTKVYKLKDIKTFNKKLKEFTLDELPLPFDFSVDIDLKDALHHCLNIGGPKTILPNTSYYKEDKVAQKKAMLAVYEQMARKLFAFTPLTEEEQDLYIKNAFKFDEIVASLVKSSEEWADYTDSYHPYKTKKVCSLVKPLKFMKLLTDLFGVVPEKVIVAEPRFLASFKTLFNEENFELYKCWAYVLLLVHNSVYLSEEIREIGGMYRRALLGIVKDSSIEKQSYTVSSFLISEPVGIYYAKKYFGDEAKKDVGEIASEIIETYKKRIKENAFLADITKVKAIKKLDLMVVKVGYPDKADKLYDLYTVDEKTSYFEALSKILRTKAEYNIAKLYQEVDRKRWVMAGHIVNACFNPTANDITFPAAILQAPFYSIKQTRSENLGGIGAVIGHEISHAFDNNGARLDENGNLVDWWTKEDYKMFKKCTKAMIQQFDGLEIYSGGKVNGTLVVSENIADNGGMAVTLDIMGRTEGASYQEYFLNWARVWRMKCKPEYEKLLLSIDVHSPKELRTNIPPRNFDEWYKAFNVKNSDKMYLSPNKRVHIW